MDRQSRVLKDRIKTVAVGRRIDKSRERIRCRDDKGKEAQSDQTVDAEHVGLQPVRQISSEQCDGGAEQGQDQDPEKHGSLVIAPYPGNLIEQRLQRMRIRGDNLD